jgi:hypothetical protein
MFAVVGDGNLLFSVDIPSIVEGSADKAYLFQFILYASLDNLDLKESNPYHENIDTYENYFISAYVTAGQTVFLLLHPKKKQLKAFFQQVQLYYAQLLMNPFYEARTPIEDLHFGQNVRQAAANYIS